MNISFQHPWVLLILPVIIAALIVSMKFMYSRNMAQKVSRIFVRFIVAALLVLALSGITFKIVGKDVTTIFLVDVSDSVKERKDEVTTYISDAIKTKSKLSTAECRSCRRGMERLCGFDFERRSSEMSAR